MIEQTFSQLGINFNTQSGQIVIDCPFCNKAKHLYIDPEKKVFYCQHCGGKGTWYELTKAIRPAASIVPFPQRQETLKLPSEEYISACHKKLLGPNGNPAIEYLYSRKLTLEAIYHFRLGLEMKDGKEWITIPYLKGEKSVNAKYRTVPPAEKEFRRWTGGESVLFNQDCLKGLQDDDEIFLVEGEIDCIALWSQGFKNVVATTVGANGIKPEWIDQLERFQRVNIVYDADEAGQKGAKEIARRLDYERCFIVILPVKDANEFFIQGKTAEDFDDCVRMARRFDVENILTIEKIFADLVFSSNKTESLLKPQWESVARLTGAYEPGDLIVLTATPKTGKTTWALNDALHFAKHGIPVLFYCLEMRPERLLRKVFQIELKRTEEELNASALRDAYTCLRGLPLWFGYNYKKCTLEVVTETIRRGVRRYGFQFIVFDNLHFLARSITHQVQEVSLISKTFKLLAEELQVPIMLIAQPRKVAEDKVVGIEDLKDSSAIGADADQVIVLYRKKTKSKDGNSEAAFGPETLVRVDASRFKAGGETLLCFQGDKGIFEAMTRR